VVGGEIDLGDLKYTELESKELKKLSLKKGDLLIVRSNGSANLVGRGAVVTDDAEGLAFAGYLIRLRVDRDRLLPEFLHLVLSSPQIRANIERQARSTSGVHNINSSEVEAIAFRLPPLDTQAAILDEAEKHLARLDVLETWCETELARSTALRQSILKQAFSGRLVPQDPLDEPANALLARIRSGQSNGRRKRARA
jgi:type I restriction enzyme S subunit